MKKTLACPVANVLISRDDNIETNGFSYRVEVNIDIPELKSVFKAEEEKYELKITKSSASIKTITFVGFIRAL